MTATFTASVSRDGDWWLVDVHDVGYTQCAELNRAEATAIDLIAAVLDLDASCIRIDMGEVRS